jgi:hypothetical protein
MRLAAGVLRAASRLEDGVRAAPWVRQKEAILSCGIYKETG